MKNSDMPAMPNQVNGGDLHGGLTKREYFAGLAIQAYITGQLSWTNGQDGGCTPGHEEAAKEAVAYADALLEELEK